VKFSFKFVTFSKSYARKQKWVFFSEHSVVRLICNRAEFRDMRSMHGRVAGDVTAHTHSELLIQGESAKNTTAIQQLSTETAVH